MDEVLLHISFSREEVLEFKAIEDAVTPKRSVQSGSQHSLYLPLEDKGIESIPLKSGEGLGLRSEHSSRFLCFTRVDSFAK
jgi:hypothetical protein